VCLSNVILAIGVGVKVDLASRSKAKAGGYSEENSDGVHCERRG
jgi:hypothetical protein